MNDGFDFQFHVGHEPGMGKDFIEIVPGRYQERCWVPDGRCIHEETFCLIEGIFEKHVPSFTHFGPNGIARADWLRIWSDLSELRGRLSQPNAGIVELPYGSTWRPEEQFRRDEVENQARLAVLIAELERWASETFREHDYISALGI